LGEGFLETLGRGHHAIVEVTTFFVTTVVERRQHLLAELRALLENRRHHIRTGFMGAQRLVMSRKVEDIVDQKAHVALGGLVLRHVDSPFGLAVRYHHATAMREPATIIVGGLNAAP